MKERPILFNAEMVNAILEGRKTQTRRVLKCDYDEIAENDNGDKWPWREDCENGGDYWYPCSFGKIGDRLWVRETFMDMRGTGVEHRNSEGKLQRYAFAADCPRGSYGDDARKDYGLKWTPSIHMPRSACRLVLEITNIRVERLNDISEEDAKAEGVEPITIQDNIPMEGGWIKADRHMWKGYENKERAYRDTAKDSFKSLWQEINGADSWDKNPWVWVVEFKVIQGGAA